MRLTISSKGDLNKIQSWLSEKINKSPVPALRTIASDGEKVLAQNTPKDTGETASGWTSEIQSDRDKSYIYWMNKAHPEASVNIARIIDLGHGTGTGGYVPPRPYISNSMESVWNQAGNKLSRELLE